MDGMEMLVCQLSYLYGLDWNISTNMGYIAMKFGIDIHDFQVMTLYDNGEPTDLSSREKCVILS